MRPVAVTYQPSPTFINHQNFNHEVPLLLEFLQGKKIYIIPNGAGRKSEQDPIPYEAAKSWAYPQQPRRLAIDVIARAYFAIDEAVDLPSTKINHSDGSYATKGWVERKMDGDRYVTNGECMAAMLLKGYKAVFSDVEENPNCCFNAYIKGTAERELQEKAQLRAQKKAGKLAASRFHPY